jgi:hypothetical protein
MATDTVGMSWADLFERAPETSIEAVRTALNEHRRDG